MGLHLPRSQPEISRIHGYDGWIRDMPGVAAWRWDAGGGTFSTALDGRTSVEDLAAEIHGEDRASWRATFERALHRGEPWICMFRLAPNGAPIRWIEERGRAWLDAEGRPARAAALRVELADGRRELGTHEAMPREGGHAVAPGAAASALGALARSEGFLDALFESMTGGVLLIGADGQIVRTNRRARELLRCEGAPHASIEEILASMRVLDARGNPVPRTRLPSACALRGDATRGIGLAVQFPNGETVHVSAGAAPIRSGEGAIVGAVLTLADPAEEPKKELARMVSHELRPSLGVILVQAKMLSRRHEAAPAVRLRTDTIVASAQRMAAMLNDLVESSLLEAGRLRLELASVDLVQMVRQLRERLPSRYDAARIRVERCSSTLPRVLADPNRLERVLVNLLTGALKRSPPVVPVTVRVAAAAGEIALEIEDAGQGIEAGALPHSPERRDAGPASTGIDDLDLYTSRVLVEAHGGTMTISRGPGGGSTLVVRLPLRPAGAA